MASSTDITWTIDKFRRLLSQTPPNVGEARELVLESSYAVLSDADGLHQMTLGQMIDREEGRKHHNLEPREHPVDPSQQVWIHKDIAAVWVRAEGIITSHGAILYGLAHVDGSWKISGVASTTVAAPSQGPEAQSAALGIAKPIDALLSGFSGPDWGRLEEWFLPGAGCTLYRPPAGPLPMTMEQSIVRLQKMVESGPRIEEKIHDTEIRSYADLGFAWAPFVVELDGVPRHEGVNMFTFLKRHDRWVFSGCQDLGVEIS